MKKQLHISMRIIGFLFCGLFTLSSLAQNNALVLNGAYAVMNGGTAGAPIYMVVNQSNTAGIARMAPGGHIHSENQYNFVKWVSGTSTGNYVFPFGVAGNAADYIPFTFNKTTAGSSDLDMSTWTTNVQNMPHAAATNVGPVTNMFGTADSVLFAIDRFWDIQASGAVTGDITFSYRGIENTTSAPLDTVKAQHWNGSSWDARVGPGNLGVVAGIGTAGPFVGQTTFSPWILTVVSPCPTAAISYPMDYCNNDSTLQPVSLSGDTTGVFSSSPLGLALDTNTGAIIPSASTPGTYTVYYTIDSTIVCPIFIDSTTVTINPIAITAQNLEICQGDSVLLEGSFQTTGGVYVDSLSTFLGCDSVVTTTLIVNPVVTTPQSATICEGDSLLLAGLFQTTTGIYYDTLTSSLSCDSIIETTLTVNPVDTANLVLSICQGDSVFLAGAFQTATGVYYDTLTSSLSCDSIVETDLTVNPVVTTQINAAICAGDSILLGGVFQNTPGIYYDTLASSANCDSILETTLTVNTVIITNLTDSICQGDSIFLGGAFQTVSGNYNDSLVAAGGCDSVLVTALTVTPTITTPVAQSICSGDSILLGGAFQNVPGVYYDTLSSVLTCDSIVETTLTIDTAITTNVADSICQGDSILLGGSFQTVAGVYNDTLQSNGGCDSILITTLSITPLNTVIADTAGPFCASDPIILTATGTGPGTITWYSDPQGTNPIDTGSPVIIANPGLGNYTYYVMNQGQCSSPIDSVNVSVTGVTAIIGANPSSGPAPLNVTFTNGSTTGPGITYYWDMGNGDTSTTYQPSTTYGATGSYTVTLIVTDGTCSDTATLTIDVFGESYIIIPNVFTPNGDGSNDFFTVDGEYIESVNCEIFNRWGQLLYTWDNVNGAWDGRTLAGSECPDGTYFFIIEAKGTDGKEYFKKGGFSLIR